MSVETVRVDYDALGQVAASFDQQCQAMQQMVQNIQSKFDPLIADGWKGDAAVKFEQEMESELLPACKRLYEALEAASATSRTISDTIQSADQDCANQFQIR